jgi:hypothetical protein
MDMDGLLGAYRGVYLGFPSSFRDANSRPGELTTPLGLTGTSELQISAGLLGMTHRFECQLDTPSRILFSLKICATVHCVVCIVPFFYTLGLALMDKVERLWRM